MLNNDPMRAALLSSITSSNSGAANKVKQQISEIDKELQNLLELLDKKESEDLDPKVILAEIRAALNKQLAKQQVPAAPAAAPKMPAKLLSALRKPSGEAAPRQTLSSSVLKSSSSASVAGGALKSNFTPLKKATGAVERNEDGIPFGSEKFAPEVVPPRNLVPRTLQWNVLLASKIIGTLWEELWNESSSLSFVDELLTAKKRFDGISRSASALLSNSEAERSLPPLFGEKYKFKIHYDQLNALFFESEEQKALDLEKKAQLAKAAAAVASQKSISILKGKRTQNIEIALKGLGLLKDFSPLRRTVQDLEFGSFSAADDCWSTSNTDDIDESPPSAARRRIVKPEGLAIILNLYPSLDEINDLKELMKKDYSTSSIASAERFLIEVLRIPRFKERSECIILRHEFEMEIQTIQLKLAKLLNAVEKLLSSLDRGALRAALFLILRMGNYVNCRSSKSVAPGVQISALEMLRGMRSFNGKTNFLRVVVEHIDEQYPEALDEICALRQTGSDVSEVNPDELSNTVRQLENRLNKLLTEIEFAKKENDLKFLHLFQNFSNEALMKIERTKQMAEAAKSNLQLLAKKLADRAKTSKEALDILKKFDRFIKDLTIARKENDLQKLKYDQRNRSATQQPPPKRLAASTPGGGAIVGARSSANNTPSSATTRQQLLTPKRQQPPISSTTRPHFPQKPSTAVAHALLQPVGSPLRNTASYGRTLQHIRSNATHVPSRVGGGGSVSRTPLPHQYLQATPSASVGGPLSHNLPNFYSSGGAPHNYSYEQQSDYIRSTGGRGALGSMGRPVVSSEAPLDESRCYRKHRRRCNQSGSMLREYGTELGGYSQYDPQQQSLCSRDFTISDMEYHRHHNHHMLNNQRTPKGYYRP